MTWLSSWPIRGMPQYAEHPTEQAAEAHALEVVRSGIASHATAFEANNIRALPDEGEP